MRKAIILFVIVLAAQLAAQDKVTVTVKSSSTVSGVVIVSVVRPATADQPKATFDLQCNKGMSFCKALEPGSYLMVKLPKNWGMYECVNVDLYPASADPETSQKLGEYCLNEN